jgi:hypothetical protein
MAECYPTGCTPCTDEIQFPENPVDGQEFCFSIGTDDAGEPIQRCWVYDHCVPGWRAKGETAATVEFKGVVNVCTQNPPTDAESGDWWIVAEDCDNQTQLDKWFGANHPARVLEGDRIAYSGTEWQVIPPAILAYASDALGDVPLDSNGKPDPDDRRGGIVKIASLSQAKACTDKCDVITPYTLCEVIDEKIPNFKTLDSVEVSAGVGSRSVCITNPVLTITATATAKDNANDSVFASYAYQWKERSGQTVTPLSLVRAETVSGATSATLTIEDFEITPVTGSRTFFVTVTATDLYNNTATADSSDVVVTFGNALEITSQPTPIDLSTGTTATVSVTVNPVNADLPAPAETIEWFFNGVNISGATVPDLGYTFADWTTNTLSVTRTDGTAGSYPIYANIIGGCGNLLSTNQTTVKGPGGIKEETGQVDSGIGRYTILRWGTQVYKAYGSQGGPSTIAQGVDGQIINPFKFSSGSSSVYTIDGSFAPMGSGGESGSNDAWYLVRRVE